MTDNGTGWLYALGDMDNRAVRVLDTFEVEVQPWRGGATFSAAPDGGQGGGLLRTKGEPVSMRSMYDEHGEALAAACARFDVPLIWAMGMAGIEAVRGHGMRWDSRSYRYEERIDDFSAGIMQTLSRTADGERRKRCPEMRAFRLDGDLGGDDHPLFDNRISALLGVAYIRTQIERYGWQPVEVCGGYNAGRARPGNESEFGVRTYGPTRVIKFICYINDSAAVLRERGLM